MQQSASFIDLIFLALVAGFLILRLRSVLGRKDENEPTELKPIEVSAPAMPPSSPVSEPASGEAAILQAVDPSFDEQVFLGGARAAFEMILEAFTRGDTAFLRSLLADHVYVGFVQSIEQRQKNQETLVTEIQRISEVTLVKARVEGRMAFATVRFASEQTSYVTGSDGRLVSGSRDAVEKMVDDWTFQRDVTSSDPNWLLVTTATPAHSAA